MNQQKPEKSVFEKTGDLQVHSVFYTIQGEGPFAGHPAVFVRLAGCNLQCPQCDTEYTLGRWTDTVESLTDLIHIKHKPPGLVVITGGEPFRQNITPLCTALTRLGYFVQIETNGTLPPPTLSFNELCNLNTFEQKGVYVVCSPKAGRVNMHLAPLVAAYKYVVADGELDPSDGLPVRVLDHSVGNRVARPHSKFAGPIYLQPADLKDDVRNQWNLQACIRSCMEHGYTLQLQIHKLIDME